ncbi:hypothetical protein GCM10009677_53640 [Sphaerisporangium rubeum]|uniref:PASTA domain-containing protein n=1 Tax=Sphaerisporangium rubeum TaxID=321317 RepID=A0A7X0II01_9ACTN|nr:PASTA domain-containing protein [Sphaerisporangium rubeum]MBB6475531.1 hypothetical protein [Sphaerisporangium rubeum]
MIAVLALGAGCLGGIALGAAGSAPSATAPLVAATATKSRAEVKQPRPDDTQLPDPAEPKPRYVKLPDFTGQNAAVAKEWFADRGWDEWDDIKLGSQDRYDTFVVLPENWTVTKQSHRPGTRVKVGTTIVLTCTKQ